MIGKNLERRAPDHFRRFPKATNIGLTFWETDLWPLFDCDESPWVARANDMDALWAPSKHAKSVFRKLGVSVPIRVIPWPMEAPATPATGLPDRWVYDLDRCSRNTSSLIHRTCFQGRWFGWSRRLASSLRKRAGMQLLEQWRIPARAIPGAELHIAEAGALDPPPRLLG